MLERRVGHVEMNVLHHLLRGDHRAEPLAAYHGTVVAHAAKGGSVHDGKLLGKPVDEGKLAQLAQFGTSFLIF